LNKYVQHDDYFTIDESKIASPRIARDPLHNGGEPDNHYTTEGKTMIVINHRGHTDHYTTEEKTIIVINHRGHNNHYSLL
jgi:hypothetical protein